MDRQRRRQDAEIERKSLHVNWVWTDYFRKEMGATSLPVYYIRTNYFKYKS